ncbi:MAG: hypothetical protein A2W52_00510 [Candidatus Taylorbacteria bacterium RIFCSPHIGHO2_02_49_25]|uniref:DNA replication/recombination mediator RecO N-terminal domain-containing protein n=1 Tax=Candidatus Taylorbacteria bacterium RIFCSPHIGHO2_02_49_25 TaxID=1802305 RepID=A0A1G2MEY2_9BACT|nr:MAG: hypothetical protein A2759_02700 [Candidatus Taylorbacteria bacterium RIFCSPHIGHO2_01_FULL_49_60]OHA22456.1 MAG: hypothetical protein A2W52_00510 [Candidatus Taylorbacteria bacterium RIFCSPHIGHO2_02_49_25]OHA37495.1 MAG: hypothetical protein A2W65_01525 [Candidatus Taylorbacteria bacterium RIFCSPLOWO2_02_50_13]OHA41346.1 MAG: hypothetical protein A3H73_02650 [Candidatus Taylorbacteria bacterium RIFCSPLOWO2_02_FULL_50_120]OHA46192.1 MAG: hypothetical protein A3G61_04015 [Candidatus Taylo
MSYHLYPTDAFVLGSTPSGEGSKIVLLFTREFGLLSASARSIREERSKLRYALQDFSHSEIALVRGRECWRVAHASLQGNLFHEFAGRAEAVRLIGRIFLLLRRLLAGEEKNEPLFHSVLGGLQFLKTHHGPDMVAGIEIVLVLRILHLLGYLAPREEFNGSLWRHTIWEESVIHGTLPLRALAVSEINHSLQQSQL